MLARQTDTYRARDQRETGRHRKKAQNLLKVCTGEYSFEA